MKTANCKLQIANSNPVRRPSLVGAFRHSRFVIRHSSSRRKAARGFTLIELLVVISVILILVGILYPVYSRAKENARIAACRTNLHQLGMLLAQYHLDHNAYPPPATGPDTGGLAVLDPAGKYTCPDDPRKTTAGFRLSYNTDDRGIGSQITYNYYGYDANGYDVNTPATYLIPAQTTLEPPQELKDQGIDSWLKFPMLANRQAPKYTIVTHCTFHYEARNGLAVILRLDGSVKAVPQARDTWNKDLGGGVTKWISQPIEGS